MGLLKQSSVRTLLLVDKIINFFVFFVFYIQKADMAVLYAQR